ncbi:putative beta-lactamase hydrolase-like protein [Podospora australis]|uniref:Beta-lactamase hydrolase-like protein n=1 Tax=Podospora australis TaxID=1536484 RepID=A0AAN7ADH4_9PEZI|nr:putative beta-lactamase hydrolase-like protein [Podospora australis]
MNAVQVQNCVKCALRCQPPTRLLLAPLFTAVLRIPTFNAPTQRQVSYQTRRCLSKVSSRRVTSTRQTVPRIQSPRHISSICRGYTTASTSPPEPTIHPVFEQRTGTFQYLVADPVTKVAVIIDPVLDYDKCTQTITTVTADALLSLVRAKGYKISRILETHAHADHLTASFYLQGQLAHEQGEQPPVCIGKRIGEVQSLFGGRYGIAAQEYEGVFDKLFDDHEEFFVGNLKAKAIHLPGHTPDHLGYKIGDNIFCGDSLFHVDIGTARCDFPGGSAHDLYQSARKVLSLPHHVKIWTGHDYPPEGKREPVPYVTVGGHKQLNRHVRDGVTEEEFVKMREERDSHLAAPRLLHESLQVNVRAGRLPKENEAGMRLLKVPVKVKGGVL